MSEIFFRSGKQELFHIASNRIVLILPYFISPSKGEKKSPNPKRGKVARIIPGI